MAKKTKKTPNEERELEQAYADLTGYDISPKKKANPIVPVLVCMALAGAVLAGCALGLPGLQDQTEPSTEATTIPTTQPDAKVSSGVTAAGVKLDGMTSEELEAALESISQIYETTDMVVRIDGAEYTLSPAHTGASLNVGAAAAAIFQASAGEFDLSPYLTLDTEYIQSFVTEWDTVHTVPNQETTWTVEGEMPSLAASDTEAACQTLVITKGTTGSTLDCEGLYQAVLEAYYDRSFLAQTETAPSEAEVFEITPVYEQYYIAPVDAVMDMTTFEVLAETYGYGFDADAAQAAWDAAAEGEEIRIEFFRIAPELSQEELSSLLFRDVLGKYSSPHTNNSNRNNNLKLACKALNGLVLYPGETFSYNQALGKRTTEKGYLPAGAYSSGEVVETVGGGICQVSSTLYFAVLKADLQIVSRTNHGMTVGYMPLGFDATVDWGLVDFKFKNNTDYPIRIEASVSGGYVNIKIIGTDLRDYDVKVFYEVNETYEYDTIYREMYADNEDGYKDGDVIVSPYTGYKVTTYRCKYDKETGELISKTLEAVSTYKKIDKVVAKIIEKPTEPTEPTEPETQPTEPPTQPTEPPTEPSEPETQPTEPETEPSEPETEPSEPETEPSEPETEPSEPETEPSTPETEESVPESTESEEPNT